MQIPAEFYMAVALFSDSEWQPCSDFTPTASDALDLAIEHGRFRIWRYVTDAHGANVTDVTEDAIAERNKLLTARGMEIIELEAFS